MTIHRRKIRGQWRFELATYANGSRKRQYFRTEAEALKALDDARKQHKAFGRAFDVLPADRKSDTMRLLQEMQQRGYTLQQVWDGFRRKPDTSPGRSLKDTVAEVIKAKAEAGCRPKYVKDLRWYLEKFIAGRESMDVRTITPEAIEDWFNARNESPIARRTHAMRLSALFSHAWRAGYIPENPIKRLHPVIIERRSPVVLTLRQSMRAIVWARRREPRLLGWLALTLFAGLRPESEAHAVSWRDIDLKRGRIVLQRSKVRAVAPRIVDLRFCPPAWAWLKLAKQMNCPLPISLTLRQNCTRGLRAYLGFKSWPADVTRHTAASNLLAWYRDAGKVAAFLGNSAGTLLAHYKALVFREDAKKWLAILPRDRTGKT